MKKLLNISVIAALAVLPLAANATDFAVDDPAHVNSPTVAETNPGYQLAQVNNEADGKLATAGYVKGAYNQAMKAINKVATTAGNALQAADITEGETAGAISVDGTAVSVHGLGSAAFVDTGDLASTTGTYDNTDSGLTANNIQAAIDEVAETAGSALKASDIVEGNTDGAISVNGTAVSVHGLGSAALVDTGDLASTTGTYDNTDSGLTANNIQAAIDEVAAAAAAAQDDADDANEAIGTMANLTGGETTLVQAIEAVRTTANGALTSSALTPYAKKTGVTQTISASTISGTVPVVTTWGTDATDTVAIAASITGATYTETAPVVPEPANP